jgi:hypothetical protein
MAMKSPVLYLALAATAGTLCACTSVQSANLKTAGMSAQMSVTADGSGNTAVHANLYVGNNITDYVDLSPGDSLAATVNGHTQTMSRSSVLGVIGYDTSFGGGMDTENTMYTVALNRTGGDMSAPSSTVTLPKVFSITGPTPGKSFSRVNDSIVVTWDTTSGDAMSYSVDGTCLNERSHVSTGTDTGTVTIAKGALVSTNASNATTTCMATLILHRVRNGNIDPNFGSGGSISGEQDRSITFTSTP